MPRVALVLSLIAVLLAGWAAWTAHDRAPGSASGPADDAAALEARVARLETAARSTPAPPALVTASAPAASAGADSAAPAPEALAEMARRIGVLEETARGALGLPDDSPLGREAARAARPRAGAFSAASGMPKVYGSIDDVASDLDLSSSQRADFDRAVADAQRELGELRRLPDADGNTWEKVEKEAFQTEDGSFRFDLGKLTGFRGKSIPGRGETYGAADQRIRDQAKRRMRDTLTPEQRDKFDKGVIDPLLHTGSGITLMAPSIQVEFAGDAPGR